MRIYREKLRKLTPEEMAIGKELHHHGVMLETDDGGPTAYLQAIRLTEAAEIVKNKDGSPCTECTHEIGLKVIHENDMKQICSDYTRWTFCRKTFGELQKNTDLLIGYLETVFPNHPFIYSLWNTENSKIVYHTDALENDGETFARDFLGGFQNLDGMSYIKGITATNGLFEYQGVLFWGLVFIVHTESGEEVVLQNHSGHGCDLYDIIAMSAYLQVRYGVTVDFDEELLDHFAVKTVG